MRKVFFFGFIVIFILGSYSHTIYAQSTPTPIPATVSNFIITSASTIDNDIDKQTQAIIIANDQLSRLKNDSRAIPIARERQILMKNLARKNAQRFLSVTLSSKIRAQLVPEAQQYIEKRDTITGTLEVMHIDDFKNHDNSKFEYTLNAIIKKYSILSPTPITPINGGKVKVDGYALDDLMVLANGDPSMVILAGQGSKEALGNQRVLALITEMKGETSPITVADAEKALFDETSPFQKFYREQSYGKAWFSGKAYKIKLDRAGGEGCTSGINIFDEDVIAAIKAQNINLDNFDRILFIPPVGYCSGVGKGVIEIEGKKYMLSTSWVSFNDFKSHLDNNTFSITLAHELGHALGVMHANFLLCDKHDPCVHQEYGNYFDVMGSGVGDFNALYKEQLNWLVPDDFVVITKDGNYNIKPLENKNGIRAAKVINPFIGPLSIMYLEARANVNSRYKGDLVSGQENSLLLNIPQRPKELKQTDVELIDMTPGIPGWNLPIGGYFFDKENIALGPNALSYTPDSSGVTIGSVKQETGEVGFHIAISKLICNPKFPQIHSDDYVPKITQGSLISIGVRFTNNDPICYQPSDFTFELKNLPAGFVIDTDRSDLNNNAKIIAPREQSYLSTAVNVQPSVLPGFYNINYEIKNTRSGLVAQGSQEIQVIAKPVILSIDPQLVAIGGDIKIIGKNFNQKNKVVFQTLIDGVWLNGIFDGVVATDGTNKDEQVLALKMPTTLCKWGDGGSCEGNFPALPGTYWVYVQTDFTSTEQFNFSVFDQKDISSPKINILSPTSDEVIEKGKLYVIKYKTKGVSNVKIDLMDYKGIKVIRNIEPSVSGDFTNYYWTVPNDLDIERNNLFTIRISDVNNSKVHSDSGKFMIIEQDDPELEVTSNVLSVEYDSNRKEVSVVSKIKVKITASKDIDLIIPKQWAFSVGATNTNYQWAGESQTTYTSTASNYGSNSYIIPKGKSADFELTTQFNPKIMFPGSYKAFMNGFTYGANYNGYKSTPDNYSNVLTIIGETSPYITSVTDPAYINVPITLTGERFGSAIVGIVLNDKQISLKPQHNGNFDSVTFTPQKYEVDSGFAKMQLFNEIGASNIYYFELLPAKTVFGNLKEQFANVLQAIEEILKFFSPTEVHAESNCLILHETMRFRSDDEQTKGEVSKLQQFLKSKGYFTEKVSGFYGKATMQAIIAFQRANNIAPSSQNPWLSAVVGPKTQQKIASLTCNASSPITSPSSTPMIISNPNKLLTNAQVSSILGLLKSFNANQSVIDNVQKSLGGTPTATPIYTPVYTPSPTYTPTVTPTPTYTPTSTSSPSPTYSPTPTVTTTPSPTYTPTVTATPTSTSTPTPTITSSPSPSPSPSSSPTSRIYFGSFVGNVIDGIKGLFR
ncbi:MAG: peptidoglycan-binding protein [Patescibacteria group bacterium]|nr:peptidoglycan-binding protein [Patescibacteria group bacterium]